MDVLPLDLLYSMLLKGEKIHFKDDKKMGAFLEDLKEIGLEPSEGSIPYFTLEDPFITDIDQEKLVTPLQIRKKLLMEKNSKNLQKISTYFYVKVLITIKILRRIYEKKKDPNILQEIEEIKENAMDLLRKRMQKILELAQLSSKPIRELMENMSFEERIIYSNICNLLSTWERSFTSKLEGD